MNSDTIYESFETQNEMVRSVLDLMLDTLPSISDSVQKIATAVAGGAGTGVKGASGEGSGGAQAANVDFSKLSDSLGGLSKGLLSFNAIAGGGTKFVKFISGLTKALTLNGEVKDPSAVATLYTAFGKSIQAIGSSITSMSFGMILFGAASTIGATKAFTKFFDDFFKPDRIKSLSGTDATEFSKNLVSAATALKNMTLMLALTTPAMLIAIPGLLLLTPALMVVSLATSIFGNPLAELNVKGFAKSMKHFGIGLGLFVLSAIGTRFIEPTDLLMLGLIVGAYAITAVVFSLVDLISMGGKAFESSAKGIAYMSLGLVAFELAAIGTRLITGDDIGKVLGIAICLTAASLVLSFAGEHVEKGAKAMLIISGAVIVAELAIWMIQVLDLKTESYLIAAGIVVALGKATIVVGEQAANALKGAGALLMISASLIVVGIGMSMLKDVTLKDCAVAAGIITGLSVATIAVGAASEFALLGAAALLVIAASVIVVAEGLKRFGEFDGKKVQDNLKRTIVTAAAQFAIVSPMSAFALAGAAVGIAVGAALITIAKGLKILDELSVPIDSLGGKNGTIAKILDAVISPFEKIGAEYTFSSLASFLTGGDNPVNRGINMCKGIGEILCEIASGVKKFSKLEFKNSKGETVTMADGDFDKVAENLEKVITCVGNAFIEVGNNSEFDLGVDFDKGFFENVTNVVSAIGRGNPLKNAISNMTGIGEILNGIATGLKGFSELKFGNATFTGSDFGPEGKIATNIKNAITCVAQAFVSAWNEISPNGEGSGFAGALSALAKGDLSGVVNALGDTPLEKAIAAFSGVSEISGGLVDIVQKLGSSSSKVDPKIIKQNISNIVAGLTESFGNADVELLESRAEYTKKMSSAIVDIAKNAEGLEKSANAMEKICKSLDNSFDKIKDLADEKIQNVKEIFDALVTLEEKESTLIEDKMGKFTDMVEKSGTKSDTSSVSSSSVSDTSKQSSDNSNSKGSKDGKNTPSIQELAAQISKISEMLNNINTKLSGTLSVAVEENMFDTGFRR